jgi:hypothetical protein
MPDQRYEATRLTVGALLSTTSPRIEVPEWQRSYSWGISQVEAFWQDLIAFGDRYPGDNITGQEYFLGSIVLVTGGPTNLLLDGQQRLATSTILLSVLRDARRAFNANAATRLHTKYISDFDDEKNQTTHVLTLNNYDRNFFRGEIQDEPGHQQTRETAKLKSHGLVRKAREYLETRTAEKYQELGGGEAAFQWNVRIAKVLCDHMSVVAVTSTDEDNAAEVFETLNDRGIGLSTPDLLRNYLIRSATDETARERIEAAWQTVLEIEDEVPVEDFLRHYWVSNRGDVKALKLYREIKGKLIDENVDALAFSRDLAETAPLYRDIARAREGDAELQRQLVGIRMLGAKALYPVLLSGYAALGEDDDKAKLRELASALITMFVRYNVIASRESTIMERIAYEVAATLRTDKDFDAAIAALAELSPDAEAFISGFRRASISRIATARYLLREVEHAKRRTEELSVEGTDRVHVEHIYPRTPVADRWPNHAAVINRLGNLTLLGKRFNTSIKNGDFATKKEKAYDGSDILMTKELMDRDTWDEAAIDERQVELSRWILDIWRFPGEERPAEPNGDGPVADAEGEGEEVPEQLPEVPTG